MTTSIRPMQLDDTPVVATLEQHIYPKPWSVRVFYDELAQPNRTYLVVEDGEEIVGYGGFLTVERDAHVTTLAIDPRARRRQLGTRLMLALVDAARDRGAEHVTLEVRASNQGAQRLYERFGFNPVGLRKNYYQDEDALVMWANDIASSEYAERLAEVRAGIEAGARG